LISTCQTEKLPFVTDPSNKSAKYARGRLRIIMPLLATEGMTVESLLTLGARAAEVKTALDHYTQKFLNETAQLERGGSLRLNRAKFHETPRATALRALANSLRFIHNDDHAPEHAALSALLETILGASRESIRTLYGCIISISETKITLLREPSAVTETLVLSAGETKLWDKRWLVTATKDAPTYTIRALGHSPHDIVDRLAPDLRHKVPQGRIRATLPALWEGGELKALPSFDEGNSFGLKYWKNFP